MATGDGWALAWRAARISATSSSSSSTRPPSSFPGVNPAPLITEAVRGAGAILVDHEGRRFAFDADPRGELAPRDVVARAVAAADATGGAWLDAREIPTSPSRFPGVTRDPDASTVSIRRATSFPVAPALHYAMGGIRTDLEGRSYPRGTLGGRRGGLHRRPWRQPPGLQLAARGTGLRRPGRAGADRRLARDPRCEALAPDRAADAPHPAASGRCRCHPRLRGRHRAVRHRARLPTSEHGCSGRAAAEDAMADPRAEMREIMTNDVGHGADRGRPEPRRAGHWPAWRRQLPPDAWRTAQSGARRPPDHPCRAAPAREPGRDIRRLDYPPLSASPVSGREHRMTTAVRTLENDPSRHRADEALCRARSQRLQEEIRELGEGGATR